MSGFDLVCFPNHGVVDACPARRVIEEHEFLERRWMHLAVFRKEQRSFREAVRLARRVEAEHVGLLLVKTHDGVADRRRQQRYESDDSECERQAGRIADAAYAPSLAAA